MKDDRQIQRAFNVKQDCFAYNKSMRKCKALNSLYCMNEECKFYKTEEQRCKGCKQSNGKLDCEDCVKMGLK